MRAFYYYLALLAGLTACDSGLEMQPAIVQWMEWPAEVPAETPFAVRLIVPFVSCDGGVAQLTISTDQSAVTFAPSFLIRRGNAVCQPGVLASHPPGALDTVSTIPGLATASARTFEMRASAFVYSPTPSPKTGTPPVRTFGEVTVRLSNPDTSRRNAAGMVTLEVDNLGCSRLRAGAVYGHDLLVLEDQADTTSLNVAFVRGYIHDAATPVCGQTRVFKLESRN